MAVDLSNLPDKGIDLSNLPDKKVDLSNLPDKSAEYPNSGIMKTVDDLRRPIQEAMHVAGNLNDMIGTAMGVKDAAQGAMNIPKGVSDAGKDALQAVGQRPELQPLPAVPDVPRGTGEPGSAMKAGAEMGLDTLEAPIRMGATLQEPQVLAQSMTTDALVKKGVNPYLAMAAGMVAGAASDPINVLSATEVASGLNQYVTSRAALKEAMLTQDVAKASGIAKGGQEYEAWLQQRVPLNRNVPDAPEPLIGDMKVNQSQLNDAKMAEQQRTGAGSLPAEQQSPEKGYTPFTSLENLKSPETESLPAPISHLYTPREPPTRLNQWKNSAVRELSDLHTSMELTAPTSDPTKDLESTVSGYVNHQEVARFDAFKMTDEMTTHIPDADRRTLVTLYSQLGRAPTNSELETLLEATSKAKDPGVKALNSSIESLMTQNLNLNDHEAEILTSYNSYFDGIGKNAQKLGILNDLRDLYGGPHVYMPQEEAEKGFVRRIITGRTQFSQPRSFENVFDAAKSGYVPRSLDSAELLGIYHHNISKAAAQKYLMGTLERQGLLNYEGEGRQVKGFQPSMRKIDGEIYARQPYSDDPKVQKAMGVIAEEPVLDNSIVRAVEKYNAWKKTAALYLQFFHPKALAAEAMAKGFSPAKFKEGLDLIDTQPEYVRSLIRSGLIVNDVKDIGTQIASSATEKMNYRNPIAFVRKVNDIYRDATFGKYMVGLKIYNSNYMMKRLVNLGIPEERAMQLAVQDSNRVFGGLNLGMMNRSPNMQRLFQLVSFAPDWTESKIRQMGSTVGMGMGSLTPQERLIMTSQSRQYWVNLTALATATHLINQINPANKVISLDLSQESGFRDVKKLLLLATGNPSYITSKASPVLRDFATLADPHLRANEKIKNILKSFSPISLQNLGKDQ